MKKKKGMKLQQWTNPTAEPTPVVEPIEVYKEGEHIVKRYPPRYAEGVVIGPTAKYSSKRRKRPD